jgi:hypothetical protein
MSYQWAKYLHLMAAVLFVGVHGASMVVFYVIRGETDRRRIESLLAFSARTVVPMYVSMALVVVTGVLVGGKIGAFNRGWGWWSIVLLGVISVLMWIIAKPIHARVAAALEMRPSGVPRVADEDLGSVMRTPRPHVVTAIGLAGIAGLVYLMTFKPF